VAYVIPELCSTERTVPVEPTGHPWYKTSVGLPAPHVQVGHAILVHNIILWLLTVLFGPLLVPSLSIQSSQYASTGATLPQFSVKTPILFHVFRSLQRHYTDICTRIKNADQYHPHVYRLYRHSELGIINSTTTYLQQEGLLLPVLYLSL
jgi:hypothetical protein